MVEEWVERLRQTMEHREQRLTPQREIVLRVLAEQRQRADRPHLSAEEVYFQAKRHLPEIGLATVYRTLELFDRLGIVSHLEAEAGQLRYELKPEPETHYHHHLICLDCGRIEEFREDLLEEVEHRVARETGFTIVDHNLRFFGYCRQCSARRAAGRDVRAGGGRPRTSVPPPRSPS